MSDSINVEVCYALRDRQEIVRLKMPEGCTVQRAIDALLPEILERCRG